MEEGRGIGRDSSMAAMGNDGSQVFTEWTRDVEDVERGLLAVLIGMEMGALGVVLSSRWKWKKRKDSPRVMRGSWFYKCGGQAVMLLMT